MKKFKSKIINRWKINGKCYRLREWATPSGFTVEAKSANFEGKWKRILVDYEIETESGAAWLLLNSLDEGK